MPENDFFRPTLLVGVGGTGCQIAEKVFLEARRNNLDRQDRIGVLAFDTDLGALRKMTSVPSENRVQISTADTVFTLLRNNPDVQDEWFVRSEDLTHHLTNLTLVEGAAQIRMLTRLALHDSFRKGTVIDRTRRAVAAVAANDGRTAFSGVINVLVVGSLAGATGSGSFYQIALMIREVCRQSEIQANIMGLFLMPDVFVRTNTVPRGQIENVKANAYASLKELNAINVLTSLPERGGDFSYSYMPGTFLRSGETPFAAVTVIDYEASRGGNMGTDIRNYIELARRAGYLLIFSPLGPSFGASAVNDVRSRIASLFDGRHNIFAGLGISALSYPADSMRDYLAYKLVLNNLDGNWIRLDELFRRRVRRFTELKAAGQTTSEEPKIAETYLRDLEVVGVEEQNPFFRDIWNELHPEVDAGPGRAPVRVPISKTFIDAFVKQASDIFWRGDLAQQIAKRQLRDASSMENPSEILEQVRGGELTLDRDLQNLDRLLSSEPETIFNTVWQSSEELKEDQWRDNHIKKWIVAGGPHPVRSRAFLYQVRRDLQNSIAKLDPAQERKNLFGLSGSLAATFGSKENAAQRSTELTQRGNPLILDIAEKLSGGGILSALSDKLGSSKRRGFVEAYVEYYNNSVRLERNYAQEVFQRALLDMLLRQVEGLLKTFVGLFSEIESIGTAIRTTVNADALKYGRTDSGADGNIWVYGDTECRAAAWASVEADMVAAGSGNEVNKALSGAIYEANRLSAEKRVPVSFNQLGDLFRTHVVDGYARRTITENFGRVWDITVIEALRREAAVAGVESWQDYLADRTRLVSRQAEPFISLTDSDAVGQMLKFWTMHPDSEADVQSKDSFARMFTGEQGEGPIIEPSFSRYELLCVNFRLNLTLDNMSKFSPGDADYSNINAKPPGEYQLAYNRMVETMIQSEMKGNQRSPVFTPHVDRDWHRPGVLPEISPDRDRAIRDATMKAAAVSICFNLLQPLELDNRAVTHFTTRNRLPGQLASVDRLVAKTHDLMPVVQAFIRMTDLVRLAESFWTETKAAARAGRVPAASLLQDLLTPDKVRDMLEISADRTNPGLVDGLASDLIMAWCRSVGDAVQTTNRELTHQARKDKIVEETGKIRDTVMADLGSRHRKELVRQFEVNFDIARDRVMAEI